jgi:TonB family protein
MADDATLFKQPFIAGIFSSIFMLVIIGISSCQTLETLTNSYGLSRNDMKELRSMTCQDSGTSATQPEPQKLKKLSEAEQKKMGGLTAMEILVVMKSRLPDITECYEKILARRKRAQGKISVSFVIDLNGRIEKSCVVAGSTAPYPKLWKCVLSVTNSSQFPKPRGDKPVEVNYPFVFKPL